MPVPAVDADKRGDAYKKVKPVDGIDEQGLVPDPQVMHVLFARLMAILGPLGILPIIFAVNSVTTALSTAPPSLQRLLNTARTPLRSRKLSRKSWTAWSTSRPDLHLWRRPGALAR